MTGRHVRAFVLVPASCLAAWMLLFASCHTEIQPDDPPLDTSGLSADLALDRLSILGTPGGGDARLSAGGAIRVAIEDLSGAVVAESEAVLGPELVVSVPLDRPLDRDPRLYVVRYDYRGPGASRFKGCIALSRLLPSLRLRVLGDDAWVRGSRAALRVLVLEEDGQTPVAGARVRGFLGSRDDPILEGETDAAGSLPVEIRVPDLAEGDVPLRIEASLPSGCPLPPGEGGGERSEPPGEGVGERAEIVQTIRISSAARIFLTTDKPLYQPGQTVHIRSLALERATRRAARSLPSVIEVEDPEGNLVFRERGETDAYGLASADFRLADRINLGTYRVRAAVGGETTERTVTVDRYVLPKFEVTFDTERSFYRPGEEVSGHLRARYFFGRPVDGAATISMGVFDVGFNEVARAEGRTDADGRFEFALPIPERLVGQPLLQGDALLRFDIQVTDSAGQEVAITRTLTVSQDTLKVVLVPESGGIVPGVENGFYCLVALPDGRPVAGARVAITGGLSETLVTDEAGVATFRATPAGALHVTLSAADAAGHRVDREMDLDPEASESVLLHPSAGVIDAGQTLWLTVRTTRAGGYCYIDLVHDGQTALTRTASISHGTAILGIPMTRDLAGTVIASAYVVTGDGQVVRDTRLLQVRDAGALHVSVDPSKDVYEPGEEVGIDLVVTDEAGRPVPSALGVAIVDEAVFALSEAEPGLARLFFSLERELLQPRYEIHGVGPETLMRDAPDPRAEALLSAASAVVTPPVDRDSLIESIEAVRADLVAAVDSKGSRVFDALAEWVADHYGDTYYGDRAEFTEPALRHSLVDAGDLDPADLCDPWGAEVRPRLEGLQGYLRSAGPDGAFDTHDDVETSRDCSGVWTEENAPGFWEELADGAGEVFQVFAVGARAAPMEACEPTAMPVPCPTLGIDTTLTPQPGAALEEPVRIRSYFPETLLWEPALITDARGRAHLSFLAADSITDWRMAVTASSRDGRLGGTTAALRVFRDFFCDLDLPVTFTQGDRVSVPLAVYSYLDRPQEVTLSLDAGDWFECDEAAMVQTVRLEPGQVASVHFPVRVTGIGRHDFTVTARGHGASDAVRREVEVVPDGRRFSEAVNGRLSGSEGQALRLMIPPRAIDGASTLVLKIYPGAYSQLVEGLEGMFRMPSGCFEQTTSTTYPNIILLRYLRDTNRSVPEVEMRAEEYVNVGYQRLVSFEVDGGGFEWFGSPPANQLLTAYGLQEFTDMARVIEIDEDLIPRTARWLAERQQPDGHWEPDPHWFELLSDRIASSGFMSTAFITWSLAESGREPEAVARGLAFLAAHAAEIEDPYTLAIVANAQAAAGAVDAALFDRLAAAATVEGDRASWAAGMPTAVYGTGDSARLETTALAAIALVRSHRDPTLTEKALNFLVSAKDSFGTWENTQGTVLALKALTLASTGGFGGDSDGRIAVVLNGDAVATVTLTPADADVLRRVDLTPFLREGENEVRLNVTGNLNSVYQLASDYYVGWPDLPAAENPAEVLSFHVAYDRTSLAVDDTVAVTVTADYRRPGTADMVILDVGIPPGFQVVADDLGQLVESRTLQSFDLTGRQAVLYVERIASGRPLAFTFHLRATLPVAAATPRSRAYLYYDPRVEAVVEPVRVEVQ